MKLTQQPRLQNAGVVIINCKVLLDQFLIQLVALGGFQLVAQRHFSSFDEGADQSRIHRPVESTKPLRLVASVAVHRARQHRSAKAGAESLRASLCTSRTE